MEYQKTIKALKNSQQINLWDDKEIPKKRYISQKKKKKKIKEYWWPEMNYNNIIMEYQKIIDLLENTPNQPSKCRTKNWVEVNDESRGTYNVNSQIKFKTSMLRSILCDYSDAYILVITTITVLNTVAAEAAANNGKYII